MYSNNLFKHTIYMNYNYEIINNILYLYLDYKYEFGLELSNYKDLDRRCNNFIKNNNIKYFGNKVYLIINGIIVKSINIKKEIELF